MHSFSLFEIEKEIPGEPKYDSLGDCFKVLFQSEIPSSPTVRHIKRKKKGAEAATPGGNKHISSVKPGFSVSVSTEESQSPLK